MILKPKSFAYKVLYTACKNAEKLYTCFVLDCGISGAKAKNVDILNMTALSGSRFVRSNAVAMYKQMLYKSYAI